MKSMKTDKMKKGKIYLVGAGPGDPLLITLRGRMALEKAEVVIYDYLASRELLNYAPANAEFVYAGKKGGVKHTHTQEEINQMLVDFGLAGKIVVRLKGGDPFIFGRGGEEIEELVKYDIAFEVIPGVTSASAAATFAGVPITHRKYTSSVAFITGHEDPNKKDSGVNWEKIATGIGTLVFYMGIKNLGAIAENLIRCGRSPQTPVAVVRWASTPKQRSVEGTLENIVDIVRENDIRPPAIVVVGEVVQLRDKINWFEKRPLFGKQIMVTRTREQASELVRLLADKGAGCMAWPTITLEEPESWTEVDRELQQLTNYQWLLFTSINAIKFFFKRLFVLGMDARAVHGIRIGVVGKATAECLSGYGLQADLIPDEFTGEGLAEKLCGAGVAGSRILLPRALNAREILPETLLAAGAEVTVLPVYRNVPPAHKSAELRQLFADKSIDMLTFTSSSTVTHFLTMLGVDNDGELQKLMKDVKIAAIGPITAKTARKSGFFVDVQPESYTIPELVDSIEKFYCG